MTKYDYTLHQYVLWVEGKPSEIEGLFVEGVVASINRQYAEDGIPREWKRVTTE